MTLNSNYEEISSLISSGNHTYFGPVPNLKHLSSVNNTIFLVVDKSGNVHTAEVSYDPRRKQISSPSPPFSQFFQELSLDTLYEIVTKLSLEDIDNVCQTNKYLKDKICDSDGFWKRKYVYDFGITERDKKLLNSPPPWIEKYNRTGNIFAFGEGRDGQLGSGGNLNEKEPRETALNLKCKKISAGHNFTLIIDLDDNVWVCGSGKDGQLGLKNGFSTPVLIKIPNVKGKEVSAGYNHSLIIDLDNNVLAFGNNGYNQLGIDGSYFLYVPTIIPDFKVKSISAGSNFSLFIDMDNIVWSAGINIHGYEQRGYISYDSSVTMLKPLTKESSTDRNEKITAKAISAGDTHSLLIDMENNVWSFGYIRGKYITTIIDSILPVQIPNIKAIAISAGYKHSLLIDENNEVFSFGLGWFGQLGLDEIKEVAKPTQIKEMKAIDISAGGNHSLIVDENEDIWSFGLGRSGQLGTDEEDDENIPRSIFPHKARSVSAGGFHSIFISTYEDDEEENEYEY